MPDLEKPTFSQGEWVITCRGTNQYVEDFKYAKVRFLADDADIDEIRADCKTFGTDMVVEINQIPPRYFPRTTTVKWIRLKVRRPVPTK